MGICCAQSSRIGFYNVQNLYDTINDPSLDDGNYTIKENYNYELKIKELTAAFSLFNPDILAMCEVENYSVVEDFTDNIKDSLGRSFAIVHYDSRDFRGIDCAVIYDTAKFTLINSELHKVDFLWRDFLRTEFLSKTSGKTFVQYTLHLPSKRGGAKAKRLRRDALQLIDSLAHSEPSLRVMVCGDMNDGPKEMNLLENLAIKCFKNQQASYRYRGVWSLLDQIMITPELKRYIVMEQRAGVFEELITQEGHWKGYPKYNHPSDHLPVYFDIEL